MQPISHYRNDETTKLTFACSSVNRFRSISNLASYILADFSASATSNCLISPTILSTSRISFRYRKLSLMFRSSDLDSDSCLSAVEILSRRAAIRPLTSWTFDSQRVISALHSAIRRGTPVAV